MTQTTQILKHLEKRPITALEALKKYGCLRLAARINDLRRNGHNIVSTMMHFGDKKFAMYQLARKK